MGQSLRGGYHYGISGEHPPLVELAAALDEAMHHEADAGRQVVRQEVSIDAALHLFEQEGETLKVRLLRVWPSHRVPLVSCLGFTDVRHGPYALSVRCCRSFHVEPYGQGLLIVFDGETGKPPVVREEGRVLFNAYTETKRWNELIGVGTVPDLNDLCLGDRIKHVIRIAEGQQEKKIAELADRIAARRDELRVVCIAGPSSSGKTTFVKRLSIQLEVNGITPRTLSLDDYYVDREKTPLDADGDLDFEALEAIDLPLLLPAPEGAGRRPRGADARLRVPRGAAQARVGLAVEAAGRERGSPHRGDPRPEPPPPTAASDPQNHRISSPPRRSAASTTTTSARATGAPPAGAAGARRTATPRRGPNLRPPRSGGGRSHLPFQEPCDAMFNSALAYHTPVLKSYPPPPPPPRPPQSPPPKGLPRPRSLRLAPLLPPTPHRAPGGSRGGASPKLGPPRSRAPSPAPCFNPRSPRPLGLAHPAELAAVGHDQAGEDDRDHRHQLDEDVQLTGPLGVLEGVADGVAYDGGLVRR